jgi:murein DD-endopeptidase MepM/ murein hydrolase activator NlpD
LGAAKLGGAGLKRIPLIGSLLSAGFGAMEANEEEMARLMQENNMSREQVQAGLADGSLQKDKGKIVARSAGAGIGAGAGAVVGGILGSALGPIGTALGAAAGSWLGENIGKFFAEPFAKIFKGFDFGETFGPLVDTFKTMTSGISEAFGQIFAAFGGGEGGEGEGEGFIGAIKKAGEVTAVLAKLSLKLLVPTLQLVMKGIELLVGGIKNLIVGAVNGIKGMIDGVMNLPFIGDQIRGALERGGGFLKAINEFADQDLSIKSDAFGTGGGQLPATGVGGGGGKPVLTSGRGMRWGKMHQGIDIGFAGDRGGQPMYLPRGAVVTDARVEGRGDAGYGNSVYFTTDDGVTHLYAHMQRPTQLRIGQSYKKGTFVGKLGNTGRSTAPHLHWETSKNEADVGRGGPGLKDPRKFGYSLNSPFSSTGSAGVSSSMNYGERSALTPTVAAASGNPISNTLRNMSGSVRGLQEQLNRRTGLQGDTGDKMDLQAELLKALGVMGGGTAAATASASNAGDGGTPVASGTVAMFPTASPVRDGGHVFEVVS